MELFNTFYDDYIEYKQYVNDVIENIRSNKELGKSFEDETKYQQSKIKLLQQEIQILKNENKDLKEENKSHLKIIELLSAGHDSVVPLMWVYTVNYKNCSFYITVHKIKTTGAYLWKSHRNIT